MVEQQFDRVAKIALIEDEHKPLAQIVVVVSALAHAHGIQERIRIFPILLSNVSKQALDAEFDKLKEDISDESLMNLHEDTEIIGNASTLNPDVIIQKLDEINPDVIISDVNMGEASAGLKLLKTVADRGNHENWQCWVMTQNPESTEEILNFTPSFTFDPTKNYLKKSELLSSKLVDCLRINILTDEKHKNLIKLAGAIQTAVDLVSIRGIPNLGSLFSCSHVMNGPNGVFEVIGKYAKLDFPVFIRGEKGTGKELVARELHRLSGRDGEIEVFDCGTFKGEGGKLFLALILLPAFLPPLGY